MLTRKEYQDEKESSRLIKLESENKYKEDIQHLKNRINNLLKPITDQLQKIPDWVGRYLLVIVLLLSAYYWSIYFAIYNYSWILTAFLIFLAAILAYEITSLIFYAAIVCALVYIIFQLHLNYSIIIGACIIAAAILYRSKKR